MEDIWTKLERNKSDGDATSSNPSNKTSFNHHLIFVGDQGSGKSTLIQTFLKPTAAKESKSTIALEYNYARRANNGLKYVAHLWEVGGDLTEPRLLEIPITKTSLTSSTVFVVCDLSKPHNVIVSILRSISIIRDIVGRRVAELQATNVHELTALRELISTTYNGHQDANRVRPIEVPIVIIANKYDALKTMAIAERKSILQVLRFVSHYFGAILISTSSNDANMRETFRTLLSAISFQGSIRSSLEIIHDKAIFVTRGQDSYEQILLGNQAPDNDPSSKVKYRLIASESEVELLLSNKGVSRECWKRLSAHMAGIFGNADPLPNLGNQEEDGEGKINDNPYPEAEVDDTRVFRDAALSRFVQEMERKQDMISKMNSRSSKS